MRYVCVWIGGGVSGLGLGFTNPVVTGGVLDVCLCFEYQTPHYNKHLHHISPRCLTHYIIGHRRLLNTHYHQTTYPSSPQLPYDMTTGYSKTDGHSPTTRKLTGHHSRKTQESAFAQTTNIHTANRIFTNIILMAENHNIPKGKLHSNCMLLPDHIVCKITQRNNIRRANTCDAALKYYEEITSNIQKQTKPMERTLRCTLGSLTQHA